MIRRLLFGLVLGVICLLANPLHVAAFDPFGGSSCDKKNPQSAACLCDPAVNPQASQSAVCTDKSKGATDPVAGPNGILTKTVNIIATIAGIAAVIVILVGSIRYITASGDSGKVSSAKNTVIYALVGLAVVVVARSIIVFVINHLVAKS